LDLKLLILHKFKIEIAASLTLLAMTIIIVVIEVARAFGRFCGGPGKPLFVAAGIE
jgi:hypothetical protein